MTDDTLETITGKINVLWQKSEDYQATLAVLMAQAKEKVEAGDPFAGGMEWKQYAFFRFPKKNGEARSFGEIRRLVRIGSSPDPVAAMEARREMNAANMARSRTERGTRVPQKINGSDEDPTASAPPSAPAIERDTLAETIAMLDALLAGSDRRNRATGFKFSPAHIRLQDDIKKLRKLLDNEAVRALMAKPVAPTPSPWWCRSITTP